MRRVLIISVFIFCALEFLCPGKLEAVTSEENVNQTSEIDDFIEYFRSLKNASGEEQAPEKEYMTIQDKMRNDLIPQGSGGSYSGGSTESRSSVSENRQTEVKNDTGIKNNSGISNSNNSGSLNIRPGEQPLYSGNQNNGNQNTQGTQSGKKNVVTIQPTVIRSQNSAKNR